MKEINLFESYLKTPAEKVKLFRLVRLVTVVGLAAYCVAVGGVISYWLLLKQQVGSLDRKIEAQRLQITQLKETESLHALIKERLRVLSSTEIQSRPNLGLVIADVEKVLPPGVWFSDLSFEKEGAVVLDGGAESAVAFADFLRRLAEVGGTKKDGWIEVKSADRGVDGNYRFSTQSYAQ